MRTHRIPLGLIAFAALLASAATAQSLAALNGMDAYNRGDIPTAYRLLRAAADTGDAEAEVNLGYMYARGQGVAADDVAAFRLYEKSAAQGDGEGMNALGYKYYHGSGVAQNTQQAIHWLCLAVLEGNPRAMNNLAGLLYAGSDVERDIAEAESLWLQAAALGHTNAMMNLAGLYRQTDPAKAKEWVVRAAEKGQPTAQQVLRNAGYRGPLPPPFDETGAMIPFVKRAAGHAKICGLTS